MKSWLEDRTPAQLLWIIAALDSLATIGFGVLIVRSWHHSKALDLLLWCPLAAYVFGVTASLFAEQALKNGIQSERWSDNLIDGPRKLVSHPAYSIFGASFFVAYLASAIVSPAGHVIWSMIFFWPLMSLIRVHGYLRPRPASANGSLLGTNEQAKPLQSAQCGASPQSFPK